MLTPCTPHPTPAPAVKRAVRPLPLGKWVRGVAVLFAACIPLAACRPSGPAVRPVDVPHAEGMGNRNPFGESSARGSRQRFDFESRPREDEPPSWVQEQARAKKAIAMERRLATATQATRNEPDGPHPSGTVAVLSCQVPTERPFVLHGTLPIPRGQTLAGGHIPLEIQCGVHGWKPAQVEVVTRSPDGTPEVVELAARVHAPVPAGDWHRFAVRSPQPADSSDPPDRSAQDPELGSWPNSLTLRCRDVFGHEYQADLMAHNSPPEQRRTLASGEVYERIRTYSVLLPTPSIQSIRAEKGKPLPHLMGLHAYLTRRTGESRISLDLRINNGATAGSAPAHPHTEPAGIVYWDALELVMPAGWSAESLVQDPFLGEAYEQGGFVVLPIVKPNRNGELHMMGPQAQCLRRLTLYPPDGESERGHPSIQGLAFCQPGPELWSWWNPLTAGYFPQRSLLVRWDSLGRQGVGARTALRERVGTRLQRLRQVLTSGEAGGRLVCGPVMGWAQPMGVPIQGMTGGSGIEALDGQRMAFAADSRGVEALMLEHRMHACRQRDAQWSAMGEPVGYHLWADQQGKVPFDFRTNAGMVPPAFKLPARGGPPASEQVRAVQLANLRPSYDRASPGQSDGQMPTEDSALLTWWPHDGQHMVRYTGAPKALVWLANDALAKDSLLHAAELFHLAFHEGTHKRENWSPGMTLRVLENLVRRYPGHGLPIGRDQAWGIDAACAAYSCATPQWREQHKSWLTRVAQLLVDGAMPNGLLQRQVNGKVLDGRYASSQTFEAHFLLHAERCLIESVLSKVEPELAQSLLEIHNAGLDYLYFGPVWSAPMTTLHSKTPIAGPRWHFAVAPGDDYSEAPYCSPEDYGPAFLPSEGLDLGVETRYGWGPLAYAMAHPDADDRGGLESRFLRRSLDVEIACDSPSERLRRLFHAARRESSDFSGSWAGYAGYLQSLGVH